MRQPDPDGADAVAHEVGRVFAVYHTFAEPPFAEVLHERDNLGIRLRPRDDLEQVHVAGGVEEVRSQEVTSEFGRETFRDRVHRDTDASAGDEDRLAFVRICWGEALARSSRRAPATALLLALHAELGGAKL